MPNLPTTATTGNDKLIGLTVDQALAAALTTGDQAAAAYNRLLPALEHPKREIQHAAVSGSDFAPSDWLELRRDTARLIRRAERAVSHDPTQARTWLTVAIIDLLAQLQLTDVDADVASFNRVPQL